MQLLDQLTNTTELLSPWFKTDHIINYVIMRREPDSDLVDGRREDVEKEKGVGRPLVKQEKRARGDGGEKSS